MESLKHECGIALIRLKKPLEYYRKKYGSYAYGVDKLYLLMEKQHNRGQEGAGCACVKLAAQAGEEFMFRERAEGKNAIPELFSVTYTQIKAGGGSSHAPFIGECYMGHLRYSTTGRAGISYVHPVLRRSNYRANTLALCGNFNLTNVEEIFADLTAHGQHPRRTSDTTLLLEQIGHRLDCETERVFGLVRENGLDDREITRRIEENIRIENVLKTCAPIWDGGYVICGLTGSGEMFAVRDPHGIRPAFYYSDDEVTVVASERPVIQTVMDLSVDRITELEPGQSIIIGTNGEIRLSQIMTPRKKKACSFERIYFSRGSDRDIYRERKNLGKALVPKILKSIDYDLEHTVFSYIPNTAETAFIGMCEGLNEYLHWKKTEQISALPLPSDYGEVSRIIDQRIRIEKVAIKDIKLRTFISESGQRDELANHVYDITYGSLEPGVDNLVVIDDSIVRGTTLKRSIITILSRLNPKKLVIVSSAPQIRYPDFYGIDMSNIGELIAFRAALELTEKNTVARVYEQCKTPENNPTGYLQNYVQAIYTPFSTAEIARKVVELVTPEQVFCPVQILFQEIEALHQCCPDHRGDWYFTGNYPTPGGLKLLNKSFIAFYEQRYKEKIEILPLGDSGKTRGD